jgi:hypothetical protein
MEHLQEMESGQMWVFGNLKEVVFLKCRVCECHKGCGEGVMGVINSCAKVAKSFPVFPFLSPSTVQQNKQLKMSTINSAVSHRACYGVLSSLLNVC